MRVKSSNLILQWFTWWKCLETWSRNAALVGENSHAKLGWLERTAEHDVLMTLLWKSAQMWLQGTHISQTQGLCHCRNVWYLEALRSPDVKWWKISPLTLLSPKCKLITNEFSFELLWNWLFRIHWRDLNAYYISFSSASSRCWVRHLRKRSWLYKSLSVWLAASQTLLQSSQKLTWNHYQFYSEEI